APSSVQPFTTSPTPNSDMASDFASASLRHSSPNALALVRSRLETGSPEKPTCGLRHEQQLVRLPSGQRFDLDRATGYERDPQRMPRKEPHAHENLVPDARDQHGAPI